MSRTLATVLAGALAAGLLSGCSERRAADLASPAPSAPAVAASTASSPASSNALAAYLRGAEIQAETDAQREELKRALRDLQALPAAQLRAARYAGGDGRPAQRDLVQVLRAHIVPPAPQGLDLEQVLADRETDAGRAALRETLAQLDPQAPR